jgi:hypothetical protein
MLLLSRARDRTVAAQRPRERDCPGEIDVRAAIQEARPALRRIHSNNKISSE